MNSKKKNVIRQRQATCNYGIAFIASFVLLLSYAHSSSWSLSSYVSCLFGFLSFALALLYTHTNEMMSHRMHIIIFEFWLNLGIYGVFCCVSLSACFILSLSLARSHTHKYFARACCARQDILVLLVFFHTHLFFRISCFVSSLSWVNSTCLVVQCSCLLLNHSKHINRVTWNTHRKRKRRRRIGRLQRDDGKQEYKYKTYTKTKKAKLFTMSLCYRKRELDLYGFMFVRIRSPLSLLIFVGVLQHCAHE